MVKRSTESQDLNLLCLSTITPRIFSSRSSEARIEPQIKKTDRATANMSQRTSALATDNNHVMPLTSSPELRKRTHSNASRGSDHNTRPSRPPPPPPPSKAAPVTSSVYLVDPKQLPVAGAQFSDAKTTRNSDKHQHVTGSESGPKQQHAQKQLVTPSVKHLQQIRKKSASLKPNTAPPAPPSPRSNEAPARIDASSRLPRLSVKPVVPSKPAILSPKPALKPMKLPSTSALPKNGRSSAPGLA